MDNRKKWLWLSLALLLIYLAFFHLCLGSSYRTSIWLGVVLWFVWFSVCYLFRNVFKNRFEYWIHQVVGLDILLEGFNPIHEGLGFYFCALCFWSVLLLYHFVGGRNAAFQFNALQPEIADSGS